MYARSIFVNPLMRSSCFRQRAHRRTGRVFAIRVIGNTRTHAHTHAPMHTHTRACIRVHAHTHTRARVHICANCFFSVLLIIINKTG